MIRSSDASIEAAVVVAIHARLAQALAQTTERYRPLRIDGWIVGWLDDLRAARLAVFDDVFTVREREVTFAPGIATAQERTRAVDRVCKALATEGLLTAWRNERYAVGVDFGGSALFLLERAAARYFGVRTYAAHVNGLVRGAAQHIDNRMWLARRCPTKSIDPNLLDNLVGGGIAAGSAVQTTLIKESWEEAGIPSSLAATAQPAGAVHICRMQPDGLHRETIFVHDLFLPPELVPVAQDGEVVEHRLVPLAGAARIIANVDGNDVVTADASLVVLDCLLRHGVIAPDVRDYLPLEALRHPRLDPMAA